MTEVTLKLTEEEVKAIVTVLGQLPTSSGAFPLMVKISQQLEAQTKPVNTAT